MALIILIFNNTYSVFCDGTIGRKLNSGNKLSFNSYT